MSQHSLDIPDGVRPYIGYRGWHIAEGGVLSSVYHPGVWPRTEPLVAECVPLTDTVQHSRWEIPRSGYVKYSRTKKFFHRTHEVLGFAENHGTVPENGCTCGIYAAKDVNEREGQTLRNYMWGLPEDAITGAVEMWGKVIRGTRGFRAQYARPIALFLPAKKMRERVEEVAHIYDIPVVNPKSMNIEWRGA